MSGGEVQVFQGLRDPVQHARHEPALVRMNVNDFCCMYGANRCMGPTVLKSKSNSPNNGPSLLRAAAQ
jgi:hypothetical protein